jgi:hypothetical protein
MARNSTLEKILTDFRLEARLSPSPADNVHARDGQIALIQSEQFRLWDDFNWPHLRVERFLPMQAGQRFYDPRVALSEDGTAAAQTISIDRIEKIDTKDSDVWLPLVNGIGAEHYASHDSAETDRASPARRWRIYEGEQIEVWPVPEVDAGADQEGYLRLTGVRDLRPLVNESDRADLDDLLLALFSAATHLAGQGSEDARVKGGKAEAHYNRLKARLSKSPGFSMFGVGRRALPRRPFVAHYKPPVG